MGRFINPFTDVGFKRIFGQEINKDLLIDFLNSLLVGERHIEDITFLDKEVLYFHPPINYGPTSSSPTATPMNSSATGCA